MYADSKFFSPKINLISSKKKAIKTENVYQNVYSYLPNKLFDVISVMLWVT